MPQSAVDYFKANRPPEAVQQWIKSVTVQQCMIEQHYYGKPCGLAAGQNR